MKEFCFSALPFIILGLSVIIIVVNKDKKNNCLLEGMILGLALGSCFSSVLDINLGLSMSLGMVVGEAIGSTIKKGN